jgi:Mor family transcriptional regulator
LALPSGKNLGREGADNRRELWPRSLSESEDAFSTSSVGVVVEDNGDGDDKDMADALFD